MDNRAETDNNVEMDNYIEFFKRNGELLACIYDFENGKRRIVKSSKNLKKFKMICENYGYDTRKPCVIDDDLDTINAIIDEFYDFISQKEYHSKINIFNIPSNIVKLIKKPPLKHKGIIIGTLTAAVVITGIAKYEKSHKKEDTVTNSTPQIVQSPDSENEYLPDVDQNKDKELESIINEKAFHFSYEDRSTDTPIENTKQYEILFETYAYRYGLDKNLLMAVAAQESNGDHYGTLDTGYGVGIMQIEEAVHLGATESAFNFETGDYDSIEVTEDALRNIETNIQLGAMILRQCIDNSNYNIPLALQTYNYGYGNMQTVLDECCNNEGIDEDTLRNDPSNNSWLQYRDILSIGDSKYVEHVFSYLPNETNITIKDQDYNDVNIKIINDHQKIHTKR